MCLRRLAYDGFNCATLFLLVCDGVDGWTKYWGFSHGKGLSAIEDGKFSLIITRETALLFKTCFRTNNGNSMYVMFPYIEVASIGQELGV